MSNSKEVYPYDLQVVERFSPDEENGDVAIAYCVFNRKKLVGARMNGIPCATCKNDDFINWMFPMIFLCKSCQAPICSECIQNCERFQILIAKSISMR